MSQEDINEMLSEEWAEPDHRKSIFGFPTRPLYREVGNMLQHWFDNKYVNVWSARTSLSVLCA